MGYEQIVRKVPTSTATVFSFIKKHYFSILLLLVLLPSIIGSVRIAVETENYTYPAFELAERLMSSDTVLDKDITTLRDNPTELIGMENPVEDFFGTLKYYWLLFYNVIFKIMGSILLIFLPFRIFYKLFNLMDDTSPAKNFTFAFIVFVIYLFIANTVIFIYQFLNGDVTFVLDPNLDRFKAYSTILIRFMPLHGLLNFGTYMIQFITGTL